MTNHIKLRWMAVHRRGLIPLGIKIPYTLFLCLLVPVYWVEHGPANFLWFSDIALLVILVALWLEHRLLTSMMALAFLVPGLAWNVDFFIRLIAGPDVLDLSGTRYMFDPSIPLPIRSLSLFHVVLPFLLVWTVYRLGYDSRAWIAQTLLAWIVLPVTYLFTDPSRNINWVFGLGDAPQTWVPAPLYLAILMLVFPLVFYMPVHFLLGKFFGRP